MKIQYLDSGSDDCPLIRIYGTAPSEFVLLLNAVSRLIGDSVEPISVEKLPGFEAVDDCALALIGGTSDKGVTYSTALRRFEWRLSNPRWKVVAGLIEPFTLASSQSYHQWLAGREAIGELSRSRIAVVISNHKDGSW